MRILQFRVHVCHRGLVFSNLLLSWAFPFLSSVIYSPPAFLQFHVIFPTIFFSVWHFYYVLSASTCRSKSIFFLFIWSSFNLALCPATHRLNFISLFWKLLFCLLFDTLLISFESLFLNQYIFVCFFLLWILSFVVYVWSFHSTVFSYIPPSFVLLA